MRNALILTPVVFLIACAGGPELTAHEPASKPDRVSSVLSVQQIDDATPAALASHDPREVGDFVTVAFSGTFSKNPFQLTQRVIDKDATTITIDLGRTVNGKAEEELRVKMSIEPATRGKVLSVLRSTSKGLVAVANTAFDDLMAKTVLATDANDGLLASEEKTLRLGDANLLVTEFRYAVRVGNTKAVMATYSSEHFAWGDAGAEITAANGKLIFKAEVIAAGSNQAERTAALAPAADR